MSANRISSAFFILLSVMLTSRVANQNVIGAAKKHKSNSTISLFSQSTSKMLSDEDIDVDPEEKIRRQILKNLELGQFL